MVVIAIAVTIAVAVIGWAIVPIGAALFAHHVEHARLDEAAFSIVKFALLLPAVSGPDAQMLVGADSRIAAHGLVVDRDAAIHATAADEILQDIGDVVVLGPGAVLGANDLPAVVLGARWGAREGNRCGDASRRKDKNCIASG